MQLKNPVHFLGLLSSLGIFLLLTLYLIIVFSPLFIPHKDVWEPAVTDYYKIESSSFIKDAANWVYFSTAPLILVLFACFHIRAPGSCNIYSLIALSLVISATILQTLAFTGQIELSRFNVNAYDDKRLAYQTYSVLSSFVFSVQISVSVFIGLAELTLIPLFSNKKGLEKNLGLIFLISGLLNLLSAVPLKTHYGERSGVFFIMSQLFMIIAMIFCIKYFRQIKINHNDCLLQS